MKKIFFTTLLLALAIYIFPDQKGENIARKNFDLKESNDSYSITIMALIDRNGNKKIRKMETFSKKTNDGRNAFVKFIEPADVSGTTFLTIGHKVGDDEQRLYLPALGKIRRISSSQKDGSFMGSDLYYFDMEDHDYEDFSYKFIKDDQYDNMDCYVVEMYPKDSNAPYSKEVAWISKENYFAYKIDCYDKKKGNQKIKTIAFMDVKDMSGVLYPQKIVVDNHKENHKTLLQDTNIKINVGLNDNIFTINNMQK